jgi:transglutaminase-like putative cysteine protease
MIRFKRLISLMILSFVLLSCGKEKHLISDPVYLSKVEQQFAVRKSLAASRDSALFAVFKQPLTLSQKEALEFLYAYMPLSDLADYNGSFFLQQVDYALKARETFAWGEKIPEDIFLHFVLPYRVNTENLDSARVVFFNELKDRVKGLTDVEAALEVNHWCREKVSYRGTDGRTSAPLATLMNAFGRCGEESTFTVTALRSVGIPARQVYTPRWAHQDDNHAWVEAYVDGKWQYMGACEPEARLNVGWFDIPAKRAMLIHTKAFGNYNGTEEVIRKESLFSELNLLPSYTKSKQLTVKVTSAEGKDLVGANVGFGLYNYAEFYPIAKAKTDSTGCCSVHIGLGDLCIWASSDSIYNYKVISVEQTDTVTLALAKKPGEEYTEEYELTVPKEVNVEMLPAKEIKANNLRLAREDSIRQSYMNTFPSQDEAFKLADSLQLNRESVAHFMQLSYGNHPRIATYFKMNGTYPCAMYLLESLSEKDIRDVTVNVLEDHLVYTTPHPELPLDVFKEGILSPRISNEMLTPWRNLFRNSFDSDFKFQVKKDIRYLIEWMKRTIKIDSINNYYNCPLTPIGVHRLKVADRHSRDIYFVALCRAFDIPARINTATGAVQYYKVNEWVDLYLEGKPVATGHGQLTLTKGEGDSSHELNYAQHYTLGVLKNGRFSTLDYENDKAMTSWPINLSLAPGYYLLVTGNRYNDGNVRAKLTFFNLKENQRRTLPVTQLPLIERREVLGQLDMQSKIVGLDGTTTTLAALSKGKGVILAVVDPANEPTRHIFADLPAVKGSLDEWGGTLLCMIPDDKLTKGFQPEAYSGLPSQTSFGKDIDRTLFKSLLKTCGKSDEILPTVLFVSDKGEIVYLSQGYKIGIGSQLVKAVKFN